MASPISGTGGQVCASGRRWHTSPHLHTSAHQSVVTLHLPNCHRTKRPGTRQGGCFSGSCPRFLGGTSPGFSGAPEGCDGGVAGRHQKTGLGAGDITALWERQCRLFQSVGTATYLFVELCLSQRDRAAGSERALVPVGSTLALGHALGQRSRADLRTFGPYRLDPDRLHRHPFGSYHPPGGLSRTVAPFWRTGRVRRVSGLRRPVLQSLSRGQGR